VICVSDDPLLGGFSATLAATVSEHAGDALLAPVTRLGARHAPAPYNPGLEARVFPSAESLTDAIRALATWEA
jgi:pyruvate dehydrogenase E1 component beta subunit